MLEFGEFRSLAERVSPGVEQASVLGMFDLTA